MPKSPRVKSRFRVGDFVRFTFGLRQVTAEVVEDRGEIGYHGRRLYRVRFDLTEDEVAWVEIPESDLTPAVRVDSKRIPSGA